MRQVLFRIPFVNLPLYGFGIMIVAGFYAGLVLAVRRSEKEKLDPNVIYDLAIWMLISGMAGARLFYVVEYWGEKVNSIADVFKIWEGGIVFYGSVFGATAAFFAVRLFRPFPILKTLDALAPSIAIGIALGRIGCFLNGCCYGDVCELPWLGVRFPKGTPPWNAERAQGLIPADALTSLPLLPTQLYAAVDGLILFALLTAYYPIRRRPGEVIGLLMLTYPVTRYLIERLRDDESAFVWGLTISQAVSVGLFFFGLFFWQYLTLKPVTVEASPPATGS